MSTPAVAIVGGTAGEGGKGGKGGKGGGEGGAADGGGAGKKRGGFSGNTVARTVTDPMFAASADERARFPALYKTRTAFSGSTIVHEDEGFRVKAEAHLLRAVQDELARTGNRVRGFSFTWYRPPKVTTVQSPNFQGTGGVFERVKAEGITTAVESAGGGGNAGPVWQEAVVVASIRTPKLIIDVFRCMFLPQMLRAANDAFSTLSNDAHLSGQPVVRNVGTAELRDACLAKYKSMYPWMPPVAFPQHMEFGRLPDSFSGGWLEGYDFAPSSKASHGYPLLKKRDLAKESNQVRFFFGKAAHTNTHTHKHTHTHSTHTLHTYTDRPRPHTMFSSPPLLPLSLSSSRFRRSFVSSLIRS